MTASRRPRTIAIIPSRYASQRLFAKALAIIGDKPMIVHVMEQASKATLVDDVIVATDDERIAAAVTAHGGKAVMTPTNIRSGTDRIAVAARSLPDADIIVNVQGDEPLIPPAMIDEAIRPVIDDASIDTGTLVKRIRNVRDLGNPSLAKVTLDAAGNCLYFSRSPIPYGRDMSAEELIERYPIYSHIGLYVFRRPFLIRYGELEQTPLERAEGLEQLRILEHGHKIRAIVTEHESVAVDTQEDLERVRALIAQSHM